MTVSPRTVVERYNLEFWNEKRFDLADELIGDELVRHDPDQRTVLRRAQARERAEKLWETVQHVHFRLLHVVADSELVTIIYQADMVLHDGSADAIAGIEVFRVVDGRIVEVWNTTHQHGHWPESPLQEQR